MTLIARPSCLCLPHLLVVHLTVAALLVLHSGLVVRFSFKYSNSSSDEGSFCEGVGRRNRRLIEDSKDSVSMDEFLVRVKVDDVAGDVL
jgi:hypothetical protein